MDADVVQLQTALLDVVVAIFNPRLTADALFLHTKLAQGMAIANKKVATAREIGDGLQLLLHVLPSQPIFWSKSKYICSCFD